MVAVLRNTGDVNSLTVRYQTFAGRTNDDLRLAYEWFIEDRTPRQESWYYLIIKSGILFGHAGLTRDLQEATKTLYARAWLDCVCLDTKQFKDETENENKFPINAFAEILQRYQCDAYHTAGCLSPLHAELSFLLTD